MMNSSRHYRYEQGASLAVTLIMLLIVLILGTSSTNMALMGERTAQNERDRMIAFHAAESALADAELDIENSTSATSRSAIFSPLSTEGFTDGCSKGDGNIYQGLCSNINNVPKAVWLTTNIASTSSSSPSVQFGRFTGQTMPSDGGPFSVQLPRYIIELMIDNSPGQTANANYMYRITAIGFGTNANTQAVVQSFYRKSNIEE